MARQGKNWDDITIRKLSNKVTFKYEPEEQKQGVFRERSPEAGAFPPVRKERMVEDDSRGKVLPLC